MGGAGGAACGLIVSVDFADGSAHLPISEYEPLVRRIAQLERLVATYQTLLAHIGTLAQPLPDALPEAVDCDLDAAPQQAEIGSSVPSG